MNTSDWRDRAPRSILDPFTPRGDLVTTPMDRRWLWRLEGTLAVCATNDTLRQLARDLSQYLCETCEHHWQAYEGDDDIPAHRQCLWCNDVEWAGDLAT